MLLAIREFIQTHRVVSSEQLSREFRIAIEALVPMLEVWISKGVIRSAQTINCGSKCQLSCRSQKSNAYEWVCTS